MAWGYRIVISCDSCPEKEYFVTGAPDEAYKKARDIGWSAGTGMPKDHCPKCVSKARQALRDAIDKPLPPPAG